MGVPNGTKQAAADGVKTRAGGATTWVSVHSGAGGTTGANEATGGGYARKQSTLTSGTTGVVNGSTVNVPVAAGTYAEGGMFDASTAGVFVGSAVFSAGSVIVSGTGASIDITPSITSP